MRRTRRADATIGEGWPAAPIAILLVQQRDQAGHAAHGRRQSCRRHRTHQASLAQVSGDLRHDVKQKACSDAAQDNLLHAPEPKEAQTDRRGQKHHGHEVEGLCQQLIVLQSIAGGGKACLLCRIDIRRQLPERHSLRGREALADLRGRERRAQPEDVALDRCNSAGVNAGLFKPPIAGLQSRPLGLDAIEEVAGGIVPENAHAAQLDSLLAARFGVDHCLAVIVALAHPKSAARIAEALVAARQFGLESGRQLAQVGGDRIIDRGQCDTDQGGDDDGGRDELPGRNAGGARDRELQAPRQIQVAEHRADEDGERHHAFGDEGHPKNRDLRDDESRDVLDVRGAPQQLKKVDHRGQHQGASEHGKNRREEAPTEIT